MSTGLQLGDFKLDIAVYTCEGTFYQPRGWKSEGNRHVCEMLVNGDGGEELVARAGGLTVEVKDADPGQIGFQVSCRHESAVKAVKIALTLPYMPMLAPERIELEEATWREWRFPLDWRAGFAVWEHGNRFFTVVTRESPWRFKRLRALRSGELMRLEVVQDASLRERTRSFQSSVWEIGYRDEITSLLDGYAGFVRQAHGARLRPPPRHARLGSAARPGRKSA